MVSPQGRREQVELACQRGLSQRRACGLISVARSTLSYELRMPAKDAPVIEAMRLLSAQYPRATGIAYPHLSSATGTGAELVQGSSLVATGWAAGAQEAGTQAHCHRKASSELAVDDEHGLGLRLCVRQHGRRAADQMIDSGGRIHPGMFGNRCGRRYSVPARHRGVGAIDQHSWRALVPSLR